MKRVIVMCIVTLMLFGCAGNNTETNKKTTTATKSKIEAVVEVAYNGQKYTLNEEQTNTLLELLDTCPYDSDQFHEETNPEGYRLTLSNSDYHIKVYKGSHIIKTIDVWKEANHAKIDEYYYFIDDIAPELLQFLESVTTS
ncbi:hypothetical protein EDD63_11111 [Breznakia blatticola]|uniref:Lipoprotein n=1 Tax=Breznakia blatticola TaxID=1754012 RepID=A0A4R7ZRN4_9FIRM|nr:hypothetical protein [Breznakia blatticola]TDW20599.1 hypothetical protein EDD63_11111 [Breznakia blatticola]